MSFSCKVVELLRGVRFQRERSCGGWDDRGREEEREKKQDARFRISDVRFQIWDVRWGMSRENVRIYHCGRLTWKQETEERLPTLSEEIPAGWHRRWHCWKKFDLTRDDRSRCWDCFVSSVVGDSQGQCFRRSWKRLCLLRDDKEPMFGLLRSLLCRWRARPSHLVWNGGRLFNVTYSFSLWRGNPALRNLLKKSHAIHHGIPQNCQSLNCSDLHDWLPYSPESVNCQYLNLESWYCCLRLH